MRCIVLEFAGIVSWDTPAVFTDLARKADSESPMESNTDISGHIATFQLLSFISDPFVPLGSRQFLFSSFSVAYSSRISLAGQDDKGYKTIIIQRSPAR